MAKRSSSGSADLSRAEVYRAAILRYGSVRKAADKLGLPKSTLDNLASGRRAAPSRVPAGFVGPPLPPRTRGTKSASYQTIARTAAGLSKLPAGEQKRIALLAETLPTLDKRQIKGLKTRWKKGGESVINRSFEYLEELGEDDDIDTEELLGYPVGSSK